MLGQRASGTGPVSTSEVLVTLLHSVILPSNVGAGDLNLGPHVLCQALRQLRHFPSPFIN